MTASEISTALIHVVALLIAGDIDEATAAVDALAPITELIGVDPQLAQDIANLRATMTSRMLFGPESEITAAATVPLTTAQSNLIYVNGATVGGAGITSFGPAPDTSKGASPVRFIRFENAQTVTALGGSIVFGAGDTAIVFGRGGTTWTLFQRGTIGAGLLSVSMGGTGAASASAARTNLGLGSVDNTSDVNKPISSATLAALNTKAPLNNPTFTGTRTDGGGAFARGTIPLPPSNIAGFTNMFAYPGSSDCWFEVYVQNVTGEVWAKGTFRQSNAAGGCALVDVKYSNPMAIQLDATSNHLRVAVATQSALTFQASRIA